jgi:hypothetical protein
MGMHRLNQLVQPGNVYDLVADADGTQRRRFELQAKLGETRAIAA